MVFIISALSLASLGLFFGLFFGLNYPEIKRHEWHLTYCTILRADLPSRYCCEQVCYNQCASAPSGSPQCGTLVSQINQGYTPSACLANSTACPSGVGNVCDGGYKCCGSCCQTCTGCSTSCDKDGSNCSTSCQSYSCNCTCCTTTNHSNCVLSCPICYSVNMDVSYRTWGGSLQNATYTQDFSHNINDAAAFMEKHSVNSTSACYYNPNNLSQVLFDVSFTPWKWAITSVFGIVPLAGILSFLAFTHIIKPLFIWGRNRRRYQQGEISSKEAVHTDEDEKQEKTSVDVST